MSREHPVSRGVFASSQVEFINYTTPRDDRPRRLHIDAVTVRCLCVKHNNALSDIDQAGIDVWNAIRRTEELIAVRRQRLSAPWSWHTLEVDGPRFERWLLKTAFNHAYILRHETEYWSPPDHAVRAVFGLEPLPARAGAAAFGAVGDINAFGQRMMLWFLHDRHVADIGGSILNVAGWPFVVSWTHPVDDLFPLELEMGSWRRESCLYHVRRMQVDGVRVRLQFDWSGRWRARDHPALVRLRDRYPQPPR